MALLYLCHSCFVLPIPHILCIWLRFFVFAYTMEQMGPQFLTMTQAQVPPAGQVWSLNHRTAREVSKNFIFFDKRTSSFKNLKITDLVLIFHLEIRKLRFPHQIAR